MRYIGISKSNGTTTLENAVNDPVYLKEAIDKLKNLREKKRKTPIS